MMFAGYQSRNGRDRKRIAELEAELAIHRKAAEFSREVVPTKTVRSGHGDGCQRRSTAQAR